MNISETERDTETALLATGSLHTCKQKPGLHQAEVGNQKLNLGAPYGKDLT